MERATGNERREDRGEDVAIIVQGEEMRTWFDFASWVKVDARIKEGTLILASTPPRMISCWPGGSPPPIKIGKTRLGTYREKLR